MRLKSLVIYKTVNNEIIREVIFNERGLSLICDEYGNSNESKSSSLGKSTFAKCIDICFGASSTSTIYKSESQGTNRELEKFISDNKVSLKLKFVLHNNKEYILERHLFDNKEYINGSEYKNYKEYNEELKNIIFPNAPKGLSLRDLIPKFIRLDNDELFRYKGSFGKNNEYYRAYYYFLNLYLNEDEIKLNEDKDNIKKLIDNLNKKYKIKELVELESIKNDKNVEVELKKSEVNCLDYVENFSSQDVSNSDLIYELDDITNDLYAKQYKVRLLEENIAKEDTKLFEIDENILQQLYSDSTSFGMIIKKYEDFVNFHNNMCKLRKEKYINDLNVLKKEIAKLETELKKLRDSFNTKFIDYKVDINDKSNSLYEKYYECKMELTQIENDYNNYSKALKELETLESKINEIEKNKKNNGSNQERFNNIFVEKSIKFTNESFKLSFSDKPNSMPITADSAQGTLGTGDTKALICALDFSFYDFFIEKSIQMPYFVIHDKMENVSLNKLNEIFDYVRKSGVQYILPILHDRINTLGVTNKEIVLKLSKESKLFKI